MRANAPRTKSAGYTLLEMLVVLGVLVLVIGVTAPVVLNQFGNAKTDAAKVQVNALAGSIEFYAVDVGRPPTEEQGLQALLEAPSGVTRWRGPYTRKASQLIDPWGNPYLYRRRDGDIPFEVYTLGSDQAAGGNKEASDVSSLD